MLAGAAAFALAALAGTARAQGAASAPTCPVFSWTTLGTAGGPVPTMDRAEPSNLLRAGDRLILVDSGDGTVNQLARIGIPLHLVHDVLISHHHLDHTGGLAAVIGLRWMNNSPGQLTVYGPPGTRELVDGIIASMQPQARVGFGLGTRSVPPADSVRVIELEDGGRAEIGPVAVTAAANSHFDHDGAPTPGAISLSYRFELGDRSIAYSGDTGPSPAFTALARDADLLVAEIMDFEPLVAGIVAMRPDMPAEVRAQMERHLFTHHLTADQVGEMAREAGVGAVLLTHYAIPPGPLASSEPAMRGGIRAHYPGPVHFGRDLASFDVGCD